MNPHDDYPELPLEPPDDRYLTEEERERLVKEEEEAYWAYGDFLCDISREEGF